nr:DDE-type integrase/transposase/recombinase [Sinirhodobacter sp. WL0062]
MFVKIRGELHYQWSAVDHEGEVIENLVTRKRDKKATLKFLKNSLRLHGTAGALLPTVYALMVRLFTNSVSVAESRLVGR